MRKTGHVVDTRYMFGSQDGRDRAKIKERDYTDCDSLLVCGNCVPDKDGYLYDLEGVKIPCGDDKRYLYKPNGEYILEKDKPVDNQERSYEES